MDIVELEALANRLDGVRTSTLFRGHLVDRQLDRTHVVIRCSFDVRGLLLDQFPDTFSVPARFTKHMMIVADLAGGDAGAIEDALVGAWRLQSG